MAKVRIEVTADDIINGVKCETDYVSDSIGRQLGQVLSVQSWVEILKNLTDFPLAVQRERWITIKLPKKAVRFVDRFDYDKKVKPFAFEVEVGREATVARPR